MDICNNLWQFRNITHREIHFRALHIVVQINTFYYINYSVPVIGILATEKCRIRTHVF